MTLATGQSDFKIRTCLFSETVRSFETKVQVKAYETMGIKTNTNQ